MNDREIFKNIQNKLSPSEEAQKKLFERAEKLTSGKKYIGTDEEEETEKKIIMKTTTKTKEQARVRDARPVYAAIAAVLALAVGAGAVINSVKGGSIDTSEPAAMTQKNEDSKTDEGTANACESERPEEDTEWEYTKDMLAKAYEDYQAGGSTREALEKSTAFDALKKKYSTALMMIFVDMYQNSELEGGLLYVAGEAAIDILDDMYDIDEQALRDTGAEALFGDYSFNGFTSYTPDDRSVLARLKLERVYKTIGCDKDTDYSLYKNNSNYRYLLSIDGEEFYNIVKTLAADEKCTDNIKAIAQRVLVDEYYECDEKLLELPFDEFMEKLGEYMAQGGTAQNTYRYAVYSDADTQETLCDDEYIVNVCTGFIKEVEENYTPVTLTQEEGRAYESGDFLQLTLTSNVRVEDDGIYAYDGITILIPDKNSELVMIGDKYYLTEEGSETNNLVDLLRAYRAYNKLAEENEYGGFATIYGIDGYGEELMGRAGDGVSTELLTRIFEFANFVKLNCEGEEKEYEPKKLYEEFTFYFTVKSGDEYIKAEGPGQIYLLDKNKPYVYIDNMLYEVDTDIIKTFCDDMERLISKTSSGQQSEEVMIGDAEQ